MIVEASAPCRVEIAGGIAGGTTVGVAIDRRAWCRLDTGLKGVELDSKDALRKARGRTLSEIPDAGPLGRVARVLRSLGLEEGLRVVTQSRVPEGAGLGEEEALAAALSYSSFNINTISVQGVTYGAYNVWSDNTQDWCDRFRKHWSGYCASF